MSQKNTDDILTYSTVPRLELVGTSECIVDGLKSICEYNSDKIRINLGKYCVSFYGDRLRINSFSHKGAIVEGTIISVEFDNNG